MELLQLRYFMTVANLSSITKAAEQLHVAQPSISQSISRLEKELDVRLFDRKGKSIQINAHGTILYAGVSKMLDELDQSLKELELFKATSVSPLLISPWPRSNQCARLLFAFSEKYPYVHFELLQNDPLRTPDISLFVAGAVAPENQPSRVLLRENIYLVVPRSHPLAQYDSIPLSYAKDADFVMLSEGAPFRDVAEGYCHIAGFKPKVVFESDYTGTLVRMLHLGQYAGFLAEYMLRSYESETASLKAIRIDSPVCIRTINLSIRESMAESPSALLFASFAQQYFDKLACTGTPPA